MVLAQRHQDFLRAEQPGNRSTAAWRLGVYLHWSSRDMHSIHPNDDRIKSNEPVLLTQGNHHSCWACVIHCQSKTKPESAFILRAQ